MMRISDVRDAADRTADRMADRIGAQVHDAAGAFGARIDAAAERLRGAVLALCGLLAVGLALAISAALAALHRTA